jgi:hypothetical protein
VVNSKLPKLKTVFLKYHIEILVFLAVGLFFLTRNPDSPYDKMIGSDGKGYYAYLPAIFIHHSFDYAFVEDYEHKYHQSGDNFFDFRIAVDGKTVNKYFPGVAILWLPFFILAHLFCLLSSFAPDGYSLPYQISIGLAAIFYLWLGLKILRLILQRFQITEEIIFITVCVLFFGTNLYYYTIEEPSFTHVYSFALINIFVLALFKNLEKFRSKWLFILAISLALIVIIRPINGLIILIIPFVAGSVKESRKYITEIFRNRKKLVFPILAGLLIMFIVPGLWKIQSGRWLLYTYGSEGFDFLKPHFFEVLFSFQNGWFVYTPIAFVSFFGIIPLFKHNRFNASWLMIFLSLVIYLISCWSVWWYGEAFGFRPLIEFYFVPAILLAILLEKLQKQKSLFWGFLMIVILLIGFNLFKSWQFKKGILPAKHLKSETYFGNFFSTIPKARVYLENDQVVQKSFFTDLENDPNWLNYTSASDENAFSGRLSSKLDSANIYSVGFRKKLDEVCTSTDCEIMVSAMVFSANKTTKAQLVIDFLDVENQSFSYQCLYLNDFLPQKKWTKIEFLVKDPEGYHPGTQIAIYFWNPAKDEVLFVDDLGISNLESGRRHE